MDFRVRRGRHFRALPVRPRALYGSTPHDRLVPSPHRSRSLGAAGVSWPLLRSKNDELSRSFRRARSRRVAAEQRVVPRPRLGQARAEGAGGRAAREPAQGITAARVRTGRRARTLAPAGLWLARQGGAEPRGRRRTRRAPRRRTSPRRCARPKSAARGGRCSCAIPSRRPGCLLDCDFEEEVHTTTDGRSLRPDMVVRLPGGRRVVVDAKTPLKALLDSLNAPEDKREALVADYARHVREHVRSLSAKNYWQQFEETPDFVVMFLPGEGFYRAAIEADPSLLEAGGNERVILASPMMLIALLRTIAAVWNEEKVAESARDRERAGARALRAPHGDDDHFAHAREAPRRSGPGVQPVGWFASSVACCRRRASSRSTACDRRRNCPSSRGSSAPPNRLKPSSWRVARRNLLLYRLPPTPPRRHFSRERQSGCNRLIQQTRFQERKT